MKRFAQFFEGREQDQAAHDASVHAATETKNRLGRGHPFWQHSNNIQLHAGNLHSPGGMNHKEIHDTHAAVYHGLKDTHADLAGLHRKAALLHRTAYTAKGGT